MRTAGVRTFVLAVDQLLRLLSDRCGNICCSVPLAYSARRKMPSAVNTSAHAAQAIGLTIRSVLPRNWLLSRVDTCSSGR